jgi:hypothetical protein
MFTFRKLLTIAGAYIAASFVAGAILVAGIVWSPGAPIGPIDLHLLRITVLFVAFVSALVAALALLPAAVVTWYAEHRGKRSPLFYCGAGAVVALAALGIYVALLIWNDTSAERLTSMGGATNAMAALAFTSGIFVLAGVSGGLTYWGIAGRKAGSHPATPVAS